MQTLIKAIATAIAGIVLGLGATWFAVERGHGFAAVQAGPWTGWPEAGTNDADPYSRAVIARSAEIPLGPAEGLTFIATSDGSGRGLDARCRYAIASPVPPARYWTLTMVSEHGRLLSSDTHRNGFTSAEVLRDASGKFSIIVSAQAEPGNWLPAAATSGFALMLRLYDTPVSSNAASLTAADMPSISRISCQ